MSGELGWNGLGRAYLPGSPGIVSNSDQVLSKGCTRSRREFDQAIDVIVTPCAKSDVRTATPWPGLAFRSLWVLTTMGAMDDASRTVVDWQFAEGSLGERKTNLKGNGDPRMVAFLPLDVSISVSE